MAKTSDAKLAEKLGVTESTIRARRARGQKVNAPRQVRLTPAQQARAMKWKGDPNVLAERFGCSPSTIRRLRRLAQAGAKK